MITHRFDYQCTVRTHEWGKELLDGHTDVYGANDNPTRYTYNREHRLTSIKRYYGEKAEDSNIYSKESYLWGPNETNQEGNLLAKFYQDGQGKIHQINYE